MITPRTSIIMPVYNTGARVVASIKSVLAQTDSDFELLVLIDASPDDAAVRIAAFMEQSRDPRVCIFDKPVNQGVSAVRNQGLEEGRGEWIASLESDDTYKPNFLECLHSAASETEADIALCAHALYELGGEKTDRACGIPGIYDGHEANLRVMRNEITPFIWDKIYRRFILVNVQFAEDIHRGEHALFVLSACANATKIVQVATACYNYTVDPNGLTWGNLIDPQESLRLLGYMQEVVAPFLNTSEGQRVFAIAWLVILVNNAQQGLMAESSEGDRVIESCRRNIAWHQIIKALRIPPSDIWAGCNASQSFPSAIQNFVSSLREANLQPLNFQLVGVGI